MTNATPGGGLRVAGGLLTLTQPTPGEKKPCLECGGEIVQSGRGRPRRYCNACRPPETPKDPAARALVNEAKRRRYRDAHPLAVRQCVECGVELEPRHRVTCSARSCKDGRYRRRHPEAEKAKQAAKYQRRKARTGGTGGLESADVQAADPESFHPSPIEKTSNGGLA